MEKQLQFPIGAICSPFFIQRGPGAASSRWPPGDRAPGRPWHHRQAGLRGLARSGWLLRLGGGAYGLPGDTLQRDACLAFLARQLPGLHVAGKTALAWRGVRHNLAYQETVVLWGDQPARLPRWLDGVVNVRYRVAHIFDAELPTGLGLAPLAGGDPELPVSSPERALLELLSETGSFEGLEEVRQLVESTRNLRLLLLDELLGHLTRIKVVSLAARMVSELELPWAELAATP